MRGFSARTIEAASASVAAASQRRRGSFMAADADSLARGGNAAIAPRP
jgi:hypothetical protein